MKELKVIRAVGYGGFITDGGKFIWDSDEENQYLIGEGQKYKLLKTERDENENPLVFFVE